MTIEKGKKVLLYYNPFSGNGSFKSRIDYIIERFQERGLQIIPVRAAHGKAIDRAMAEMDQNEYRQILVAGGDGTINICINSMMKHGISLPIAVFPTGTANDFAYSLGVPSSFEQMVDIALGDSTRFVDVGKVNNRYFINVAAMGTLVDVSQKTDPDLKNNIGVLAYYLKGLSEVPNLKPIPMTFITDDKVFDEKIYFMVVMNGKSAGGFKNISPEAEIDDGLLDVVIFKKMSFLDLPKLLIKVLKGHQSNDKNVIFFKTHRLRIESPVDVSTDIDGETGEKFPLDFSVLSGGIEIFASESMYGSHAEAVDDR